MSDSRPLFLLSSNYRAQYASNALRTLALPAGSIERYRYKNKWLSKDLLTRVRAGGLEGTSVCACLLYQTVRHDGEDKVFQWEQIYPLRFGELTCVFSTGPKAEDIAYFYFALDDYFGRHVKSEGSAELQQWLKQYMTGADGRYLASLGTHWKPLTDSPGAPSVEAAYAQTVDLIDPSHLDTPDSTARLAACVYIPRLTSVDDRGKHQVITPARTPAGDAFVYELNEQSDYAVEVEYYFPHLHPGKGSSITIERSPELFWAEKLTQKAIDSPYDRELYSLRTRSTGRRSLTTVRVTTHVRAPSGSDALNFVADLPVAVSPDRTARRWLELRATLIPLGASLVSVATALYTAGMPHAPKTAVIGAICLVVGLACKLYWPDG